jgi:SAM-dependent methyltransferase
VIRSDIFSCPDIDLVCDGQRLPFADDSLRGIAMTNVLHHLPRVRDFFSEALRCVRRGGTVAMVEPWVTGWSKWVYTHLHHEPFDVASSGWEFPASGPLSGANGALPWIIFSRDRTIFEKEFPAWEIRKIQPIMPLRYLLSGGVGLRSLSPGWTFDIWHGLEHLMPASQFGMFALVVLHKKMMNDE